jgi:hypothetical protein
MAEQASGFRFVCEKTDSLSNRLRLKTTYRLCVCGLVSALRKAKGGAFKDGLRRKFHASMAEPADIG